MTYKRDLGKIEISQKLFADDFEKALLMQGLVIKLEHDLNDENSKNVIMAYLNKHFSIEINGNLTEMQFLGTEWEDYHSFYVFWELNVSDSLEEITVINDVFLEVSTDQQNMHHIDNGDKKKSLLLQLGKTKGSITF